MDDLDAYLGEFRRGPAIFSVFRNGAAHARYRVMCSDGNGPFKVCTFTDDTGIVPRWHGAWNGDEWCRWIEEQARAVVKEPHTH